MISYRHTQRGPIHFILLAVAAAILVAAIWAPPGPGAILMSGLAILFVCLAACFAHLTIADVGDGLSIEYGPLPVFRKKIRYDEVTSAEAAQSDWLDGGGIHYIPGRGWIFNLWGTDCVKLTLQRSTVRLGTDDLSNLLSFVKTRISS